MNGVSMCVCMYVCDWVRAAAEAGVEARGRGWGWAGQAGCGAAVRVRTGPGTGTGRGRQAAVRVGTGWAQGLGRERASRGCRRYYPTVHVFVLTAAAAERGCFASHKSMCCFCRGITRIHRSPSRPRPAVRPTAVLINIHEHLI